MRTYIPLIIIAAAAVIFMLSPSGDNLGEHDESGKEVTPNITTQDDLDKIEAVIKDVLTAGRNRDFRRVMEHFSKNYADAEGADHNDVKKAIERAFQKYDRFDGEYSDVRAEVYRNEFGVKEAAVRVRAYISGVKSGIPVAIIGSPDSLYEMTIIFEELKPGGWKIVTVDNVQ